MGKLTVARALASVTQGSESPFVVVDNHLTSRPILEVVDADGVAELQAEVWNYVGEIREIVYRAVERLAPPHLSFVFTNVLVRSEPASQRVVARLSQLAQERSTTYVPVLLTASMDKLADRVVSPGRSIDRKWVDVDAVLEFTRREELVEPEGVIRADTTEQTPGQSADEIRGLLVSRHGDDPR